MFCRTRFAARWVGWVLAAWVLGGCAVLQSRPAGQWPEGIPLRAASSAVPFYDQKQYQCGPASLAMVLTWSGVTVTPDQITGQVFTPALRGSLQSAMIAGTRRNGRLAYVIDGKDALFREIAAGYPVIVLQNLGLSWFPVWHYAVVFGYDVTAEEIYMHSGPSAGKRMSAALFEKTWARSRHWGLLVLAPDRLPATANESTFVEAAVGLENAGQPAAALTAFRTALGKWPGNFVALMGVGNSHYALNDLKQAAEAFEDAIRLHPAAADAYNNLAQVRFELQQTESAEKAARRAVELGGPNERIYRQTLNQIQSGGKSP